MRAVGLFSPAATWTAQSLAPHPFRCESLEERAVTARGLASARDLTAPALSAFTAAMSSSTCWEVMTVRVYVCGTQKCRLTKVVFECFRLRSLPYDW